MQRHVLSRTIAVGMIAVAIGLSGCGRKGALEAPPGMAIKPATAGTIPPADDAGAKKPDKHFVLDPLLK